MGPKKDNEPTFTEVEKSFLQLELEECNRKVARLKAAVAEHVGRSEKLQQAYNKLEEDRREVIALLGRTLSLKNEENSVLKENIKDLEENLAIESKHFKKLLEESKISYETVKNQLTAENKLITSKVNALEEFRSLRVDLMMKFEMKEQDFKDKELKYKRIIYSGEKKYLLSKDMVKKEMEERLLHLAQNFQDETELRIATSTFRALRENIAINKELDNILYAQETLVEETRICKENTELACLAKKIAEEERDKAIEKSIIELKVIDHLTATFEEMKKEKPLYDKSFDFVSMQTKMESLIKENESLALKGRILEQNLHARISDINKTHVELSIHKQEYEKLTCILKKISIMVKAALKLDDMASKNTAYYIINDRHTLLAQLLDIICECNENRKSDLTETLVSIKEPLKRKSILEKISMLSESNATHKSSNLEKASSSSIFSLSPSTSTHY